MMSFWWRKDLVRPGGAGQVDAIWMAESDSDDREWAPTVRVLFLSPGEPHEV